MSYFGDVNFIINKIENFSHRDEYNSSYYKSPERIQKCIDNKTDLYDRPMKWFEIKVGDNPYLPKNFKMLM